MESIPGSVVPLAMFSFNLYYILYGNKQIQFEKNPQIHFEIWLKFSFVLSEKVHLLLFSHSSLSNLIGINQNHFKAFSLDTQKNTFAFEPYFKMYVYFFQNCICVFVHILRLNRKKWSNFCNNKQTLLSIISTISIFDKTLFLPTPCSQSSSLNINPFMRNPQFVSSVAPKFSYPHGAFRNKCYTFMRTKHIYSDTERSNWVFTVEQGVLTLYESYTQVFQIPNQNPNPKSKYPTKIQIQNPNTQPDLTKR